MKVKKILEILIKLKKMSKGKKRFLFFFLFIFVSISLKIDYRFVESINCCQDDHDYYSHAETIAIDFDFDYENQLKGFENKRYNNNGKIAPKGFVGTGILASPFLFIGNIFDNIVEETDLFDNKIYNFKILFYSFSSIFYFFLSIYLIFLTINRYIYKIKIFEVILIFFGSGLSYFAFERYSMTHAFEAFSVSLLIYISTRFYDENRNLYAALIPIVLLIGLLTRWVNYYLLIIPLLCKLIIASKNSLTKNKSFYISGLISVLLFSQLSKAIYGIVTFNPQIIYNQNNFVSNRIFSDGVAIFLIESIKNFFIVLFTQEFGVFWFSSVIFIGLIASVYLLIVKPKEWKISFLILLVYMQNFGLVLLWKSTASSYGFRYLFSLVPFSLYIFFYIYKNTKVNLFRYYLILFSIFGALSVLFFETTLMTQLSLTEEVNSFGVSRRFTQPNYLSGFLGSFFEINSYLKIFTTSFLGILLFKLIFLFVPKQTFIDRLNSLGLPTENEDFSILMDKIDVINFSKISISFFFLFLFCYFLIYKAYKKI